MQLAKEKLRKEVLNLRGNLSKANRKIKSQAICKKIAVCKEVKNSQKFFLYLPIKNEVDAKPIIKSLQKADKEIYLPAFKLNRHAWKVAKFINWNYLETGPQGILQPKYKYNKGSIKINEIEVAIIPGVAFDKSGVRLGWGKGVYDKLLTDFKGIKIGLAYEFQIVDKIPKEKHDLVMDIVVTEQRIIRS